MAGEMTASEMRCVLAVIGPIVAELEAARLDAERYQAVRVGHVYIETEDDEFYAVIGENHGKYYSDKRDFDTDLDFFNEVTLPQQKGET
jgi:hypothetical protein